MSGVSNGPSSKATSSRTPIRSSELGSANDWLCFMTGPLSEESTTGALASVCLITFNHERFIAKALDSVLMQRCEFPFEIVVGVDRSPDNTAKIVHGYSQRHLGIIRPIFHHSRVGMKKNFLTALAACSGRYVAVLSGDDYWLDRYKIQKEVLFFEHRPEYVLLGENALVVNEDRDSRIASLAHSTVEGFDFDTAYLMERNPCVASAVMFRNIVHNFPPVYFQSTGEDRRLYLLLSMLGKCRWEPDVVTVYRRHGASITGSRHSFESKAAALREEITNAENWDRYFGGRFADAVVRVRAGATLRLFRLALRHRRLNTVVRLAPALTHNTALSLRGRLACRLLAVAGRLLPGEKSPPLSRTTSDVK